MSAMMRRGVLSTHRLITRRLKSLDQELRVYRLTDMASLNHRHLMDEAASSAAEARSIIVVPMRKADLHHLMTALRMLNDLARRTAADKFLPMPTTCPKFPSFDFLVLIGFKECY
jgi:hypothetical protein